MIRLFLILILNFIIIHAKEDINKKIEKTSTTLDSMSKTYGSLNKKMAKNAQSIVDQKNEIAQQQERLATLQIELEEKKSNYEENVVELKKLKSSQSTLKSSQQKVEEELVLTMAKAVSLSLVVEESHSQDAESLMELSVLGRMLEIAKEQTKKLNEQSFKNTSVITTLNQQVNTLEVSILDIDMKRKELLSIQKTNKKALKDLVVRKDAYKKELETLLSQQDLLKNTLANLNIIKIDEIKKVKDEEERKIAFAEKQKVVDVPVSVPVPETTPAVVPETTALLKVKKHGSSYQEAKTKEYTGEKTIAPLDFYTITKKYGSYTDPIYGIKIFNESISLKPKESNAKVKTVFNGKVIYADKTAVLNNIVIIENNDGIHTIYANLSQISPNITNGNKIKKGYTIGRVNDELIFEVTQKSYHIDPIKLFQ